MEIYRPGKGILPKVKKFLHHCKFEIDKGVNLARGMRQRQGWIIWTPRIPCNYPGTVKC